jgi:putative nucleotidyltransferase with HDIG domain
MCRPRHAACYSLARGTGVQTQEQSNTDSERDALHNRVRGTLTRLSRTGALPSIPGVATAALALARDPEADFDKLCRIVRADVGLSARILRVANSVGYARSRAAKTLKDALVTVGLQKACDLLVVACARQMYDTPSPHAPRLWKHSLAVAIAAEEIARTTRRVDPSAAFLPGLFHDVGRIAFLLVGEESFDTVASMVSNGVAESRELEVQFYEFDHNTVGAVLAEEWGLAPAQCEAIRLHHTPAEAAGNDLALLLNAADALAYSIGLGASDVRPSDVSLEHFEMSRENEAALTERVANTFTQQSDLFGS